MSNTYQLDEFTLNHLNTWLKSRFSASDFINKDSAFDAILRLISDDPAYWLSQSWPDILRASDFVERFESEKPCHNREAMEKALQKGKLYVRTDAGLCWHVRALEFDDSGNVKRFNTMFQPLKRFDKVELYGITNESFYTLDF